MDLISERRLFWRGEAGGPFSTKPIKACVANSTLAGKFQSDLGSVDLVPITAILGLDQGCL